MNASKPTRESIRALLIRSDAAVEEALLRLHARQTSDEKRGKDAKHRNSRGFSAAHAFRGSKYAEWIIGMRLERMVPPGQALRRQDHKDSARELVLHYLDQLLEEADAKQTASAPDRRSQRAASQHEADLEDARSHAEFSSRRDDNLQIPLPAVSSMVIARAPWRGCRTLAELSLGGTSSAGESSVEIPLGSSGLIIAVERLGDGTGAVRILFGTVDAWFMASQLSEVR
jgi:hypothetical protein